PMPAGHQNSFGNRTLPSLAAVVVRDDQPVNLVTAFEDPVRPDTRGRGSVARSDGTKPGIAAESARRLDAELDRASRAWGLTPLSVASLYDPEAVPSPNAMGPVLTFDEVLAATHHAAAPRLSVGIAGATR